MARFSYGGQALIEGVLMRGRNAIAVAFRHPDGRIVWASEPLNSGPHGWRLATAPFVRGLVVLYETLVMGTRWLIRSANLQAADESGEGELGKGSVALMLGLTLVLGVGLFFIVPLVLAQAVTGNSGSWVQHLIEGLVKVLLFLGYLTLISRAPDIQRVFQYHGAEHMSIHALEAGEALTTANVRRHPTAHPRCGTEFLVVLVALSIVAFALVGKQPPLVGIASRVVLIPVLAAVGYEVLRWGARHRANPLVAAVMWPGILVQKITTKQPSDDQIEVAIVSLEQALEADGESVPADSDRPDRAPLDPVAPRAVPA
ncbi:MAG: DUF1385 domain-containing protein [Chloroflexi bacterium]|nr:DUF1385 domain-containing protein [Chloroflexota bacterium]